MLSLSHTPYSSTSVFLNSALDTLEYYGFESMEKGLCKSKSGKKMCMVRDLAYVLPHEHKLTDLTKTCLESDLNAEDGPKLLYNVDKSRKRSENSSFGMHVIGSNGTVAEITILSTLNTLLKKLNVPDFVVHINSVGDRESKMRFIRDLGAYMRSVSRDLPTYAKHDIEQKSPLLALVHLAEHEHPIARSAPNPMEYLNDESRARLRKILEYMEHAGINYELNPALVGSSDCWTHTIFEVRAPEGDMYVPLACGGRYNTLARRAYGKRLASVGVIIEHEVHGRSTPKRRKNTTPKFFITYLGDQARMRAFSLLEDFYSAGIRVGKSIAHSHIGGQIHDSEKLHVPYLIIIGHKEALDGTAIVRNTTTRIQKIVPATQLVSYVSRLKV